MHPDDRLAHAFTAKYETARATLRREMDERGLTEEAGWRIAEFTREVDGRIELVMRPIHSNLSAPEGLECVVSIDEPRSNVDSMCTT